MVQDGALAGHSSLEKSELSSWDLHGASPCPVALGPADESQRRARASARVLDDGVARGEQTVAVRPSIIASAIRSFMEPVGTS
jgi:hypothetical protein